MKTVLFQMTCIILMVLIVQDPALVPMVADWVDELFNPLERFVRKVLTCL